MSALPETPMATIRDMVRRVVERFQPEQVILFGSFARGTAGPDSDVDLLVVLPTGQPAVERTIEIRMALRGTGLPKDVFVVTADEVQRDRDVVGTLVHPALREGTVLYERRA
jgi:predicted nucleotidyltransferase